MTVEGTTGCGKEHCDGSHLAYKRHRTRGEKPCRQSKRAWATYYRNVRSKRAEDPKL